jgi:hypothetical protein
MSADAVVTAVGEECGRHPVLPRKLVVPVSMLVVSEALPVDVPGLIQMITSRLWCAAFDDVFDRELVSRERMAEIVEGCRALAWGAHLTGLEDEYSQTLFRLLAPSRRTPLWDRVQPFWADLFLRFVDGSWYEFEESQRTEAPGLEEYLARARHSIGLPWLLIAETALLGDLPSVDALPSLSELAVQCGLAVRLSNDLASFDREIAEATLNAVALVARQGRPVSGPDHQARVRGARLVVESRLEHEVAEAHRLGAAIAPRAGLAKRFVRAMDVGVQAYAQGDPRAWGDEDAEAQAAS